MKQTQETLRDYAVDIACLRKYPRSELVQKSDRNQGIQLKVQRPMEDQEMTTTNVQEI